MAQRRRTQMRFGGHNSTPKIVRMGGVGQNSRRDEKGRSVLPKQPKDVDHGKGTLEVKYGEPLRKALMEEAA